MADLSDFLKKKLQSDFELRQKEALSARPSLASLQEQVPASLALTGDRTNDYDDRDDGKQLEASPSHPPYIDMILEAIKELKRRVGSSRQKIEQYILGNFSVKLKTFRKQIILALKRGVAKGLLVQVRGCGGSGSFKINREVAAHRKPLSVKVAARAKPLMILKRKQPVTPLCSKENIPASEGSDAGGCARQTRAARKHAQAKIRQQLDGTLDQEIESLLTQEEKKGQARGKNTKKEERNKDLDYSVSDCEQSTTPTQPSAAEDDGLCEYERQRLRNIEENRAFMASLNLLGAKEDFSALNRKPRREKREKEEPVNLEPRRKSLRLQRLGPNGLPLPSPLPKREDSESPVRKPAGPLRMECTNTPEYNQEAAFRASIIESLKVKVHDNLDSDIIQEDPTHPADEPSTPTVDDSASSYSQLSFSKAARIFQSRNKLQCFQFHPVSERNLVAAGSRNGHLALWDMDSGPENQMYHYKPHSAILSDMAFPCLSSDPFLYTCSYDGTVRRTDFERGIFDEVYSSPSEEGVALTSCDLSSSSDWLLVGCRNGAVMLLDVRAGKWPQCSWRLHRKPIKSAHLNPSDNRYFATASADCTAAVWDCRYLTDHKSSVHQIRSKHSISSAFFSPLTGKKLLVTSNDNSIRVYQSLYIPHFSGISMARTMTIAHDNRNMPLQAQWDSTETYFTIGSSFMQQVEIFSALSGSSTPCYVLAGDQVDFSCFITAFHPRRPLVGAASFTGKAYLWS